MSVILLGRAAETEEPGPFLDAARATGDDATLATALVSIATQWYVLGNLERCSSFAEEATLLAQRIGNPTLIALSATYLGAALETTDPTRARSILETAIEHGTTVGPGTHLAMPLAWLARMGTDAVNPQWAAQFRSVFDLAYEAGDVVYVLAFIDLYAQALATTERAESAAVLSASTGALSPHMANPISVAHRRDTDERLLARLGEERFAELTAHGATFGYDETVALALAELDHAIAADDGG